MSASAKPKVAATMCMRPDRYPDSLRTIESLKGQADTLHLCLNDFWEVPSELKQDWINILHLGRDLGDMGKFYLLRNSGPLKAHVISCDDDIEYPKSYVQDFLTAHREYPDALLTHHGEVAVPAGGDRFKYQTAVYCHLENQEIRHLAAPDSGVSFIPEALFNQLEFNYSARFGQLDIHLACNCHQLQAPIIGLPHAENYIQYTLLPGQTARQITANPLDRMEKVYIIYHAYGLSLAPPEPEPGASPSKAIIDRHRAAAQQALSRVLKK